MVKQSFYDESLLKHFTKGLELAKEIGNEQLVYDAYQKTIMLASTSGLNEIAFLYVIRTYEFMKGHRQYICCESAYVYRLQFKCHG